MYQYALGICCICRYYILIEAVRAELVAAMETPNTARRLARNNPWLIEAPKGNPKPFVKFDGPLYKIRI